MSRSEQLNAPLRTTVDLFAGVGGFRFGLDLGFRDAGSIAKCVFASEWDKHARQTYLANHGGSQDSLWGDVTKLSEDASEVPEHTVLTAGFPCQPFSLAGVSKRKSLGYAHGFQHPTQGTLFFDVLKILHLKRPRVFVLENVVNLLSHAGGDTYRVIKESIADLGYHTQEEPHRIIDSSPWVPQRRRRVFIVGFRDEADCEAFRWPKPPTTRRRLGDILSPEVDPKYTLSDKLWEYLKGYAESHRKRGNGFGYGLVGPDDITRTLSARYYKDGAEILVDQPGLNPRRLTPEECSRLMGFPAQFIRHSSDVQAYRQMGNSVVVPVVRAIGRQLERAMSSVDRAAAAPSSDAWILASRGRRQEHALTSVER